MKSVSRNHQIAAEAYLRRIGYYGELSADVASLHALHRHQVMSVPFEALDVQLGRPIRLGLPGLFEKVVVRRRGGFCYELNWMFCALLRELGFAADLVSARIWSDDAYGPEFDHVALVVRLAEPWLADVGFGKSFIEPLRLLDPDIQPDTSHDYRLERMSDGQLRLFESRRGADAFAIKYSIDLQPRAIGEFAAECSWKQSAPTSYFVRNTICTLPTEGGRRTILNDVYKEVDRGGVREVRIDGDAHLHELLAEEFEIDLRAVRVG